MAENRGNIRHAEQMSRIESVTNQINTQLADIRNENRAQIMSVEVHICIFIVMLALLIYSLVLHPTK
jgi:hypothetical protein